MLDCIDEWLDAMGKGREVVDPDKIPWDALMALASQSIFGGKVDNDFDLKICSRLLITSSPRLHSMPTTRCSNQARPSR